jgi:hypothetical protein
MVYRREDFTYYECQYIAGNSDSRVAHLGLRCVKGSIVEVA